MSMERRVDSSWVLLVHDLCSMQDEQMLSEYHVCITLSVHPRISRDKNSIDRYPSSSLLLLVAFVQHLWHEEMVHVTDRVLHS
jgi:hypothetical protein